MLKTEEIPVAEHQHGEWVIDKEATVDEEGARHCICAVCGERIDEIIPKLDPVPTEPSETDPVNPTEPTDPTEPSEPTKPEDSTKPSDVTEPEDTSEPTQIPSDNETVAPTEPEQSTATTTDHTDSPDTGSALLIAPFAALAAVAAGALVITRKKKSEND